MDERYNVYFDGQVIAGHDVASVRENLARLFNADAATLDKLFSGRAQLIKRGCDTATAQKFKAAMARAGAVPIIQPADSTTPPATPRPMSAAEKIAALAAAPDETRFRTSPDTPVTARSAEAEAAVGGIALSPPGTDVLRAHERATPIVREVDTSGLAVDESASRLSDAPPPPPAAPDTRHLSMGTVGELIPNLPSLLTPVSPAVDGLELCARGTDFSDCTAPQVPAPLLDVSRLSALRPGELPREEEDRRQRIPVPEPSTDHLTLAD